MKRCINRSGGDGKILQWLLQLRFTNTPPMVRSDGARTNQEECSVRATHEVHCVYDGE